MKENWQLLRYLAKVWWQVFGVTLAVFELFWLNMLGKSCSSSGNKVVEKVVKAVSDLDKISP